MKTNEGKIDRAVRTVIGILFLALWAIDAVPYGILFLLMGLIAVITGITGFCAIYKILGINTCKEC